jgi:hypothetical protein
MEFTEGFRGAGVVTDELSGPHNDTDQAVTRGIPLSTVTKTKSRHPPYGFAP